MLRYVVLAGPGRSVPCLYGSAANRIHTAKCPERSTEPATATALSRLRGEASDTKSPDNRGFLRLASLCRRHLLGCCRQFKALPRLDD